MLMLPTPDHVTSVSFDVTYFIVAFGDMNSKAYVTVVYKNGYIHDSYVVVNGNDGNNNYIGIGKFAAKI